MAELSGDDEPAHQWDTTIAGTRGQGAHRARYFQNHCKGKIMEIEMPAKAPEMYPQCKEVRRVRVYCESCMTVWLSVDDAAWAIEYLRDQLQFKGVPSVDGGDTGPAGMKPNAPLELEDAVMGDGK